jgi:AbrB family looped-hinge helix DNA binding protein
MLYLWEIFNKYNVMQENDGKYIFGVVKVGEKGQIVIPRDARKQYDIKPGDALLVLGDQKGMALLKTEVFQSVIDQAMEGISK